MVLTIDNCESFTFNLVQYLQAPGAEVKVVRNDELSVAQIEALAPERIVISPGACTPNEPSEAVRASGIKLVLDGYKTWGVQMRGSHALLRDAGIDHAYGETRREMHRWDTAWLSDCVDALARRAGTAGGESVEPVR